MSETRQQAERARSAFLKLAAGNNRTVILKDIAAAQSKISEVDMFRGFLDTYRGTPKTEKKESKPK